MSAAIAGALVPRRRNWLGWPGLVVALIGLALTVCGPWLAKQLDPPPQPKPTEELVSDIVNQARTRIDAKLRGETLTPVAPQQFRWSQRLPRIALAINCVGLVLGAFGLICREHVRVAAAAAAFGAGGVVLQMLMFFCNVSDW